jgi:hypothetical protein
MAKFAYVANIDSNDISAYNIASKWGPDDCSRFALPSAGQARFSGYHPTAAFEVASRNGKRKVRRVPRVKPDRAVKCVLTN